VGDAAAVLEAIAGYDPADVTTSNVPVSDYVSAAAESPNRFRVGVPRSHFYDHLDAEVAVAVEQALLLIKTLVREVKEIQLPVEEDRTLQKAESYAYHAENAAKTPELYQPETLRRILSGANVSAVDYLQRRRELEEARRGIHEIFATVDLMVTPTMPMPAPSIQELRTSPDRLRPAELKLLRNTRPFNVWGLPTISVPCGFTHHGLPIGVQIAGPPWREDFVLSLASACEQPRKRISGP
jgi:Asp-tRNA(Asn)/Glu-tRNA(Gln) amidotransferase A subunit family amidase